MEGPRGLRKEELPSAAMLANSIFRRNGPHKMEEEFPILFSRGNLDNMRVFTDAGKVVSLVGMSIRDAMMMGCRIHTVSIGAVCTHPEYRGRGLATKLMEDATKRARRKGVELMLISGGRGLYRRLGCINAGIFKSFFITRGQLGRTDDGGGLSLRKYEEGDMVDLVKLHQSEPIRFVRPREEFSTLLAAKRLCDRASETYVISRGKKVVAYVCIQLPPGKEKPLVMMEYAGSRALILGKLRDLMDEVGTGSAIIEAPSADAGLECLLLAAGAKHSTRGFMGTVKLIDVKGFLERIDPYVTEILGTERRDLTITYRPNPPELKFKYGGQRFGVSGADRITAFFFGSLEGQMRGMPEEMKGSAPELGELLAKAFPMPLVDYGLNYV